MRCSLELVGLGMLSRQLNVMGVGTTGSSECPIGSPDGHIVVIEGCVNEADVQVGASMRQVLGMV